MFEESAASAVPSSSSIWASMNSWFTPTVLFLLLNLTIATIAFTSSLANHHQKSQNNDQSNTNNNDNHHNNKLGRSPSLLQRLKSINFNSHYNTSPHQEQPHKPNPDDNNPNPVFEHIEVLQSQYFFQENQAHYAFEQTHQSIPNTNQTHLFISEQNGSNADDFISEQNGSNADDFEQTHYTFGQTHQSIPQETQTHFVSDQNYSNADDFEQTHHVFEQIHQNIPETTQAHFISESFEQAHQNVPKKTQTHFFSDQNVPNNEEEKTPLRENEQQGSTHDDEVHTQLSGAHFIRTKSDTDPSSGEIPAKLPAKMRKSASVKSAFGHFEEEDIAVETRRPATVRERGSARVTQGDEEVDAKADDFINRFKQQLKLQRLDSIIRYKDTINGKGR